MNLIERNDDYITIALSRRNLLTLLAMLDKGTGMNTLRRTVMAEGVTLAVRAEEDEVHYASEARQPQVRGVKGIGPEDVR